VVLLNNDMRVDPGFPRSLARGFRDPQVSLVRLPDLLRGPEQSPRGDRSHARAGGRMAACASGIRIDPAIDDLFPCFYGGGGSCAFDRLSPLSPAPLHCYREIGRGRRSRRRRRNREGDRRLAGSSDVPTRRGAILPPALRDRSPADFLFGVSEEDLAGDGERPGDRGSLREGARKPRVTRMSLVSSTTMFCFRAAR